MSNKVTVTEHAMCSVCAMIVAHGCDESGALTDEQHQARCNHIDCNVLPAGGHWQDAVTIHDADDHWTTPCCACGALGANHTTRSAH